MIESNWLDMRSNIDSSSFGDLAVEKEEENEEKVEVEEKEEEEEEEEEDEEPEKSRPFRKNGRRYFSMSVQ